MKYDPDVYDLTRDHADNVGFLYTRDNKPPDCTGTDTFFDDAALQDMLSDARGGRR